MLLSVGGRWREILVWAPIAVIVACTPLLGEDGNWLAGGAFFAYLVLLALGPRIVFAIRGQPVPETKRDGPKWISQMQLWAFVTMAVCLAVTSFVPSWSSPWTSRQLPGAAVALGFGLAALEAAHASRRKLAGKQPENEHLQTWGAIGLTIVVGVGVALVVFYQLVANE